MEAEGGDEGLGEEGGRQRGFRVLTTTQEETSVSLRPAMDLVRIVRLTRRGKRRGFEANGAYLTSMLSVPSAAYGGGRGRGP